MNQALATEMGVGEWRAFGEECSRNPSRREDGYCKRRRPHTRSMGLGAKEDAEETDEMDEDDERRDDARDGVGSAHGHRAIWIQHVLKARHPQIHAKLLGLALQVSPTP